MGSPWCCWQHAATGHPPSHPDGLVCHAPHLTCGNATVVSSCSARAFSDFGCQMCQSTTNIHNDTMSSSYGAPWVLPWLSDFQCGSSAVTSSWLVCQAGSGRDMFFPSFPCLPTCLPSWQRPEHAPILTCNATVLFRCSLMRCLRVHFWFGSACAGRQDMGLGSGDRPVRHPRSNNLLAGGGSPSAEQTVSASHYAMLTRW